MIYGEGGEGERSCAQPTPSAREARLAFLRWRLVSSSGGRED